jgi:deferrochelatase/peroxidase EfeB
MSGRRGVTRRDVMAGAALLGIGAGLDRLLGDGDVRGDSDEVAQTFVSFYGEHQAGITTLQPEYLVFATFDVTSSASEELRGLLQEWTAAATALTKGALSIDPPMKNRVGRRLILARRLVWHRQS